MSWFHLIYMSKFSNPKRLSWGRIWFERFAPCKRFDIMKPWDDLGEKFFVCHVVVWCPPPLETGDARGSCKWLEMNIDKLWWTNIARSIDRYWQILRKTCMLLLAEIVNICEHFCPPWLKTGQPSTDQLGLPSLQEGVSASSCKVPTSGMNTWRTLQLLTFSCHALESFSWLLSSCLAGAFGRHVTCTLSSPVHPHLYLSHRGSPLTSSYWGRAPPHKQLYTEEEADRRAPGPIFGALRTHHIPGTVDTLWKQEHAVD